MNVLDVSARIWTTGGVYGGDVIIYDEAHATEWRERGHIVIGPYVLKPSPTRGAVSRDEQYGIAGRAAGEAVLEHGRDGAKLRPANDAFLLSRIARAVVDALAEHERGAVDPPQPDACEHEWLTMYYGDTTGDRAEWRECAKCGARTDTPPTRGAV